MKPLRFFHTCAWVALFSTGCNRSETASSGRGDNNGAAPAATSSPSPNPTPMPLPEDTLSEVDTFVRAGFYDRDEIVGIFLEELYAPGDLDPQAVRDAVDSAFTSHDAEKQSWPAVTDYDRLKNAFESLRGQGVIAMHNAGNTQSDGFSDFREALVRAPDKTKVAGYCFYHWQDVERAVAGEGLYLAFGPSDPEQEETQGVKVGNLVMMALKDAGLRATWNGSFDQRILLPDFDWKRR